MTNPPVSNPRDRTTRDPQPANDRAGALAELRARVENATHGSLFLDLDVMEAVWPTWKADTEVDDSRRYVTSSLDAALALCERVLPGAFAGLQQNAHVPDERRWSAWLSDPIECRFEMVEHTRPTPALALLSAMLAALEASPLNASADGSQ